MRARNGEGLEPARRELEAQARFSDEGVKNDNHAPRGSLSRKKRTCYYLGHAQTLTRGQLDGTRSLFMCMMSTTEGTETIKTPSKRERAYLGQIPGDFLRVEAATTVHPSTG